MDRAPVRLAVVGNPVSHSRSPQIHARFAAACGHAVDYTRSYTTPGQSTVFVNMKDTTKGKELPNIFYQVRKHVQDIQGTFPQGVRGPFFNDEFGDVFGNVYAFTADGLSFRQLRDYVENVRNAVLKVPTIGKTQLIGAQDEVIYLDFSTRKLAGLGINTQAVIQTLQAQNAIVPSGVVQAGAERVSLRVGGQFRSEESLRGINLRVNDRFFRLSDVAEISRGYVDPPSPMFRYNGTNLSYQSDGGSIGNGVIQGSTLQSGSEFEHTPLASTIGNRESTALP